MRVRVKRGPRHRPPTSGIRLRSALFATVVVLAATALACQGDEITHFQVPKSGPAPAGAAAAPAMAGGGSAPGPVMPAREDVPPPPTPSGGSALRWTLPRGWSETQAGGMRYATLKPATPGKIDVSVVVLPGPAGGELANVNRWRGQIGLPPLEEPALASARKSLASKAGPVKLYDFVSDGQAKTRLLAGLASADGNTWFVKMVGDAEPVGAARADFIRLLESLRFDSK